jgi:putative flavoprotein involved in K+ transport
MVKREYIEVLIVGAGQAGVSLSYYLQQQQIPHILIERDRPFSSWHNRWDGFSANTPNWMNKLPMLHGNRYPSNTWDGFATKEEIADYFQDCLNAANPPVKTNTNVDKIIQLQNGNWQICTSEVVYEAPHVAICIGAMCTPKLPAFGAKLAPWIPQLHSSQYRNPEQVLTNSVLLVGSGSSGMQICKLLIQSGRFQQINLCVSNVLVLPRRIFGFQVHRFLHLFGFFDVKKNSLLGKLMYSRLESKGDPIMPPSPNKLAKMFNIRLFNRLTDTDGNLLRFSDGKILGTDDLTVIWCTGFQHDYAFIESHQPDMVFDVFGYPKHKRGVVDAAPGLYFVGLRYQHTVASHDIYGVGKDAKFVADHIARAAGRTRSA